MNLLIDPSLPVAERNAAFAQLTPQEQRVATAQDILRLLGVGKFKAAPGVWGEITHCIEFEDPQAAPIGKVMEDKHAYCEVCARGAAALSRLLLTNPQDSYDAALTDKADNEISGFTFEQTDLMENAFEGYGNTDSAAYRFYRAYPDPTRRLQAIYENVIANHGTFIPEEKESL